jgi:pantoate--beta-alanine ligase
MTSLPRREPRTITTIAELRGEADRVRAAGRTVGFLGTSGNLHEGHLSLVRKMRTECDLGIMPLFLEPVPGLLEFEPGGTYARNFDSDRALAFGAGLDIAFQPTVAEMYPQLPLRVRVTPDADLSFPWEGAENPAFMSMAATAQIKYWNIVGPCRVYCGEKDWVPLTVLRRMIVDLSIAATLVPCPSERLPDGLCESSRNARLNPQDRANAPVLFAALQEAAGLIAAGERDAATIKAMLYDRVNKVAKVDYAEVVDAQTLHRVNPLEGELRLLVSADFGGVHLFDNLGLTLGGAMRNLKSPRNS